MTTPTTPPSPDYEVGINNPQWHDNTPTPYEIAYYALNHGVAKQIVTDKEAEDSKAAIKQLLAHNKALREALEAVVEHANKRQEAATVGLQDPELHRLPEPAFVAQARQALAATGGKDGQP